MYEATARGTDQIADAPTIELLDDDRAQGPPPRRLGAEVLDRLCDTDAKRERRRERARALREKLVACGGVTGDARHGAELRDPPAPLAPA